LLKILGGMEVMIESPLIQEILAGARHNYILRVLRNRLGSVPDDLEARLRVVQDEENWKSC
jgi:hypothetical protein